MKNRYDFSKPRRLEIMETVSEIKPMSERELLFYLLGILGESEDKYVNISSLMINHIRQKIKGVLYPYPNTTWFHAPKDWQKIILKESAND